ncbi:hypothetical protein [Chelatococcus composti]|mgnify:FL=1|jgi:hypothetical protein|uniref:Uncharacterized protein n=1 Tax=Chelatococcus composti TaxID=1743235 RepID=A0A841KAZ8_9HYPH|nr:hypothetical protein [Chelatococcus composti]MBB6169677.1 hypothetical protein [Chelatococcus composti]MBS7736796.1 hypothetical protein [Chelatococcus composti]GGG49117.1 hypothetical protein GCM10008026_32950 [Chelatococcus composti]
MRPITSALGPVADAVARRLAEGDPTLFKQCEHPECVLWFYDRTKARVALVRHGALRPPLQGCTIPGEARRPCRLEAMFEG